MPGSGQRQHDIPAKGKAYLVYYTIAFIEGGALMACELMAGKIIAPYYGGSLYVWTSVLGCTLGGLAAGYYLGGKLSTTHASKTLTIALFLSVLMLVCIRFFSDPLMESTLGGAVQVGSMVSCLLLILPLILCFGIVSPVLIRLVSDNGRNIGKSAGTIYAVSTAGGVVMTFTMGFYLLPSLGLTMSVYVLATILSVATALSVAISKNQH